MKYAHISFAAYTHYQEMRTPSSRDVCIRYTGEALGELQREIENFSGYNVDAIVMASIGLAGTADDW